MKDIECVDFLQRSLPALGLRWKGFRRVRGQVCKRIARRMAELGLPDISAYGRYLDGHPEEWQALDSMCRITISRFRRDRGVFDALHKEVLPAIAKDALAAGEKETRCWSVGCSSGEEPYTLQIIWKSFALPALPLKTTATDTDQHLLERAQRGVYRRSSLKELPDDLIDKAFERRGESYVIDMAFTEDVEFLRQDVRSEMPPGQFHLILCRNLVLTYFDEALQVKTMKRILERLVPGGFLVVGIHESLPEGISGVVPYDKTPGIYQKAKA